MRGIEIVCNVKNFCKLIQWYVIAAEDVHRETVPLCYHFSASFLIRIL